MANTIELEFNGYHYQVLPITGIYALELDRKVFGVWSKLHDFKGDADFLEKFSSIFSEMEQSAFENLLLLSFRGVSVIGENGQSNISLNSVNAIAEHFASHRNDLYSVLVELWKANKLSPFV